MHRPKIRSGKASRVSQKQPLESLPTNTRSISDSNRQIWQPTRIGSKDSKSFALNKQIVVLGDQKKWREILDILEKEKDVFDNVNYSTVMVQLSKNALLGET